MAPIKNVVIVGAGGNVGAPITTALLSHGFNVTAIAREGSTKKLADGVKIVTISEKYEHDELVAAFKGQDAVISTITTAAANGQKPLIDAAIAAGVRRFIPSEFGNDLRATEAVKLVPFFEDKVETLNYLKARQDKIEWTAIPNGAFYDWGLEYQFFNIDVKESKATLVEGGKTKFSTTSLPQVGEWVAQVLLHADQTANLNVPVESFYVSQLEILAAVEKSTGKKFTVEHLEGQKLIKDSQEAYAAGNFLGGLGLIQATLFLDGYAGTYIHDSAPEFIKEFGFQQLDFQTETDRAVKAILG